MHVSGATKEYVNSLRRYFMDHTPILAVETVKFQNNTSVQYDEMIAHRIGLMPLTTDLSTYVLKRRCKCGGVGCAQCTVQLSLQVKGPKTVYAEDFKTTDPKVKPVYPKMILAKLFDGQEISLVATASVGQGVDHAKWSAGHAWFRHTPHIKIKNHSQACAKVCPTGAIKFSQGKLTVPNNGVDCTLCNACIDVDGGESVEITTKENDYLLFIEPWGQLDMQDYLKATMEEFDQDLDELGKLVKDEKSKK